MASKVLLIWLFGYHSTCVANTHIVENLLCIDIRFKEEISFKSAYLRLLSAALITNTSKRIQKHTDHRLVSCLQQSLLDFLTVKTVSHGFREPKRISLKWC